MITVTTDKETFISGSYGAKNFNIPYSEETYLKMKDVQKVANSAEDFNDYTKALEDFEALTKYDFKAQTFIHDNIVYVEATDTYHLRINDIVIDSVHIPFDIMDIVLDNIERDIDVTPIVKMCVRFMLNPKPTQDRFNMLARYITQKFTDREEVQRLVGEEGFSEEVALDMATYADLQITEEGYIRTSKVVEEITKKWSIQLDDSGKPVLDEDGNVVKILVDRYAKSYAIDEETGEVTETVEYPEFLEDRKFTPAIYRCGDKFFSGGELGYKYEIGKLASLPDWTFVDTEDERYHQRGLHTGGLRYIEGYYNPDCDEILDVFVCPSQIAKFTDSGLGEMTCKEFYVYGASRMKGNLRSMYHTSKYTSTLIETLQEALIAKVQEGTEELDKTIDNQELISFIE